MNKIAMLAAALLVSTASFAASHHIDQRHTGKLAQLGTAFQQQGSSHVQGDHVDMVYGGEDVSRLPTLAMVSNA